MEEKMYFKNSKGDRLCGILRNPTGDKSKPIVVLAHGFSASKDHKTYTNLAENLAKNNISTFRFDFYGHGESEGKFEDITVTEAVDDALSAVNFVKSLGYPKIGLMGSSFGGIASIIAASKSPELFVLALKSPVSNFLEMYQGKYASEELNKWKEVGYRYYDSGDGRKLKLNYSFFEDFKNNNGYEAAVKIKSPTIIVHGDADEQVPYEQSVKTSKLIPDCRLHTVKGSDHRYTNPEHFAEVQRELTSFIVEKAK